MKLHMHRTLTFVADLVPLKSYEHISLDIYANIYLTCSPFGTKILGAMSQSVSTLYGLLASNGLPGDVFEILSKPPWNMSTIQQLANSFETKKDILS
eukprot:8957938-Karenia_brevis.AAC.1